MTDLEWDQGGEGCIVCIWVGTAGKRSRCRFIWVKKKSESGLSWGWKCRGKWIGSKQHPVPLLDWLMDVIGACKSSVHLIGTCKHFPIWLARSLSQLSVSSLCSGRRKERWRERGDEMIAERWRDLWRWMTVWIRVMFLIGSASPSITLYLSDSVSSCCSLHCGFQHSNIRRVLSVNQILTQIINTWSAWLAFFMF